MEEVDNTLLRCVEEGSCHGVVLSISTEKLEGKGRKELEVAAMCCPRAEQAAVLQLVQSWGDCTQQAH